MKPQSAFIATILILIAGIILTIAHPFNVFSWIIIILGIVFIIPGIYVIATLSSQNQEETLKEKNSPWINIACELVSGVGSVILGISMIGWHEAYMKFLPIIFGVILILGGCYHFCAMAMALRSFHLPLWLYIMPLTLTIEGSIITFAPKESINEHTIVLMTGLGLIIFAINSITELWVAHKSIGKQKNDSKLDLIETKKEQE